MKVYGIAGLSLLGCVGAVQLASWSNSTYDVGLSLGSVWEFPLPAEWVSAPPLDYSYGRCNYAAVTATNVATGVQETGYIRYGIENHGSCYDSHCSGDWGRFCMVKGGPSGSTSSAGVDDFPYFNTWVHHSTPNCRTTSDSGWGGGCGGSVLTFWALGGSGWETVYAWSGKVYGTAQVWTRTMVAGEQIRVGFDAAGSNAPAPPPPTPAPPPPTPPPTPSPTPSPTASPTPSPAPTLLCSYSPRAVTMYTDAVPGDFQGTDDSCVSGGGYNPPPTGTYFGHITADQFHGHSQKVGCLEFTLDIDAYIVTRYGRHAAWSQTCPITVFVGATRTSDTSVTGTIIDEIGASNPGYYSQVFTSSTYPAGTQFMMCEGRDNSICGMTIDYIQIYGGAVATPSTPSTPGSGGVQAVGDPHLQNVHGQKFDLMKAGKHVLINIPKGESAEDAMLRVEADARRLGGCSDMYFQELNVTGSWAEQQQAGGYRYSVSQPAVEHPQWVAFYTVELKVVHGHTQRGFEYLNLYVKHLGRAGFAVGGLLGDDDHTEASAVPAACRKKAVALVNNDDQDESPPMMSSAEATYL